MQLVVHQGMNYDQLRIPTTDREYVCISTIHTYLWICYVCYFRILVFLWAIPRKAVYWHSDVTELNIEKVPSTR